jgi:hypothetical protein
MSVPCLLPYLKVQLLLLNHLLGSGQHVSTSCTYTSCRQISSSWPSQRWKDSSMQESVCRDAQHLVLFFWSKQDITVASCGNHAVLLLNKHMHALLLQRKSKNINIALETTNNQVCSLATPATFGGELDTTTGGKITYSSKPHRSHHVPTYSGLDNNLESITSRSVWVYGENHPVWQQLVENIGQVPLVSLYISPPLDICWYDLLFAMAIREYQSKYGNLTLDLFSVYSNCQICVSKWSRKMRTYHWFAWGTSQKNIYPLWISQMDPMSHWEQ